MVVNKLLYELCYKTAITNKHQSVNCGSLDYLSYIVIGEINEQIPLRIYNSKSVPKIIYLYKY